MRHKKKYAMISSGCVTNLVPRVLSLPPSREYLVAAGHVPMSMSTNEMRTTVGSST